MGESVRVSVIPNCDLCSEKGMDRRSHAYAKLDIGPWGPWAYVCKSCFDTYHCSLGTGRGQRLILDM